jgi:hypothetical protein
LTNGFEGVKIYIRNKRIEVIPLGGKLIMIGNVAHNRKQNKISSIFFAVGRLFLIIFTAVIFAALPTAALASTLLSAGFNSGTDGFVYQSDLFMGTSQSGYASGTYELSGGFSGGGLHVLLGGKDSNDITGMSGGWTYTLNLASDESDVLLSFRYRLQQSANYEYDEFSRVLVSVDGVLLGRGAKDYVDHVGGDGDGGIVKDTGWLQHQISLGTLRAGSHTINIGGYNNHKNASNESTDIWIDDVVVSGNQVSASTDAQTIVNRLDINQFKAAIQILSNYGDRCRMTGCAPYSSFINAQNWVEHQLSSMGYAPMKHNFTYSGFSGSNLYATKIGMVHPEQMYIISAHLDGRGGGGAADDDGSGVALLLEAARVLASPDVQTDVSVRFIFWDNEESGLYGSSAYVNDRRLLQGIENPSGSGQYPEPKWLGIVHHDMILYDHGVGTPGLNQSPFADLDVEWRAGTTYAASSKTLADNWRFLNGTYSTEYPANSADNSTNTDDTPFQNYTSSVSVRENRRGLTNEWINPYYHKSTDVYASYSESDFKLGFNAVQATVGIVAELAKAQLTSPNITPVANAQSVTTNANVPVNITLTGSDPAGAPLTFRLTAGASHGTLSGTAPSLTYTPVTNYSGSDSFSFVVDNGNVDSLPATVSVTVKAASPVIHVGDLDKSTVKGSKNWTAKVTITVHDANHAIVSGAAVTGAWTGGYTGSATCTTGSSGTCTVTSGNISNVQSSVTFTVNKLAKTGYGFDLSKDHDPDSDSNGTVITVLKP